jgi:putative DNA primase/helicase
MVANIPLFLTNDTKRQLRELGHSEQEIATMTPEQGWQTLLLTSALAYAQQGWYVFPCVPGEKRPLTEHGFKDATRDPTKIKGWWAKHPLANIGIDCGRSKIVVVDLDVKSGHDGPGEWHALCQRHQIDDQGALEQSTPSGGIHKIWHSPNGTVKNSAGKLAQGVDTRGDGGYILVAPSRTVQGSYVWEVSGHPADRRAGSIPSALLELCHGQTSAIDPWEMAAHPEKGNGHTIPDEIDRGQRNVTLTSLAGSMRRRGADRDEILAALRVANQKRGNPPMEDQELVAIAESMERYRPDDAPATEPPRGSAPESILLRADASDEGNARCVQALYQGDFLHCEAYGWMTNAGTHWARELAESDLDRAIVDTLIRRRVAAARADREQLVKVTRGTAHNVRSAKYLFRSLVPAKVADFDNSPDLLNCQNGVLNLRTGQLMAHSSSWLFTYCLPVEYDPDADFTKWQTLLLDWVGGDPQLVDFLQMAIGYTLTGHTSEECLFYLYGPTRSGKGTFTETLLAMLGKEPLAVEVDFSTFTMDRSHDAQNFDLAPLKPCRFVAASESSKYTSLNSARVKSITGGNEVYCAFKHRDHFSYRPQFKVWLSSNYPANADVDDDAIWYRLKVINFPNSYVGREDKTLKQQLKQTQSLQAVLTWAVKGAIRWYNQEGTGLRTPKKVQMATMAARMELDYVGMWLEECIEITGIADHFVPNSALYLSYSEWCKENGVTPKHKRSLTMELKRKGLDAGQKKYNRALGKQIRGVYGVEML